MGTVLGRPALEAVWSWSCGAFPPPVAGRCHSGCWHGVGALISSGERPLNVPSAVSPFPFAPFHEKPRAKQCKWELLSVSIVISCQEGLKSAALRFPWVLFRFLFCFYLRDCCRQETLTLIGSSPDVL